jgi:hypothetical protein
MIKYLLTLYVTINGNCYQDRVLLWGDGHEIHIVSSELNIHAERCTYKGIDTYKYYCSGDTLYAFNKDFTYSFYVDIQAVKVGKKKLEPLYGVILNSRPCLE